MSDPDGAAPPPLESFLVLNESADAARPPRRRRRPPPERRRRRRRSDACARVTYLAMVGAPAALGILIMVQRRTWFLVPERLTYDFERNVNVW